MNKSEEEEDFGLSNIIEIFKEESEDIRNKTLGIPFRQLSMSLDRNDMFRRNLGGGAVQDTEKRRICSNIGLSALIPDCYMSHKRLELTPSIIKNFDDDTVFYIFYANPKTNLEWKKERELIKGKFDFDKAAEIKNPDFPISRLFIAFYFLP
eukprot:GHVP01049593.1.p1 GENE.GHVP01049593.1~~GHVP01049593.1.p1  ORF type:complete len:152 (-),score=38.13 GHVP01049593.1:853-1308(-)